MCRWNVGNEPALGFQELNNLLSYISGKVGLGKILMRQVSMSFKVEEHINTLILFH